MSKERYWHLEDVPPPQEKDPTREETDFQYPSPAGYLRRLPQYEKTDAYKAYFADRPVNNPDLKKHLTDVHFRQVEAMRKTGVAPDATVLSLAMGDGADALLWAEEFNHTGRIIGVNLHPIFAYGQWLADRRRYEPVDLGKLHLPMDEINADRLKAGNVAQLNSPQVSLIEGDVTDLTRIPTSSIDAVTLNNFGHHATLETLIRALLEVSRVLKEDGILGFSGRDILNMYKHWNYVPHIADELKATQYPETFYDRCTAKTAEELINAIFTLLPEHNYTQNEHSHIPGEQREIYIEPFFELIPHIIIPPQAANLPHYKHPRINPSHQQMSDAIDKIVVRQIEFEISRTGEITDGVAQYYRIAKNNKFKIQKSG
jgi:ubiquinone/menaquinone biosynthesis C-methylase UbiE